MTKDINTTTEGPTHVELWENGQVKLKEWRNEKGQLHREDSPASVYYYENGQVEKERYYVGGELHRTDGPAEVCYYENGQVKWEDYYVEGTLHRTDGPACVWYYVNGQVDRERYYMGGVLHRTEGPARVEYYDNRQLYGEQYYVEGVRYRTDGPAIVYYYENGLVKQEWYYDAGVLHREDGPAIIDYDRKGCVTENHYYITRRKTGLKDLPHTPISKSQQQKEKKMTEETKHNQYLVKRIEIPGKVLKMYEVPMVEGLATRMLKNYTLRVVLEEFLLEQIGEQVEDAFPVQCEENTERGSFFGVCPFMEDHRQCNWVTFYIEEEA